MQKRNSKTEEKVSEKQEAYLQEMSNNGKEAIEKQRSPRNNSFGTENFNIFIKGIR